MSYLGHSLVEVSPFCSEANWAVLIIGYNNFVIHVSRPICWNELFPNWLNPWKPSTDNKGWSGGRRISWRYPCRWIRPPTIVLYNTLNHLSPVFRGYRICRLHFCGGVRHSAPLTSVLDMALNYLMMRLQSWIFGNVEYTSLPLLPGPLWLEEVISVRV